MIVIFLGDFLLFFLIQLSKNECFYYKNQYYIKILVLLLNVRSSNKEQLEPFWAQKKNNHRLASYPLYSKSS